MLRSFQVADEDSANGWSRTTTAGRRRLYRPLSSPVLGVREGQGRPTGFEPAPRGSRPRMLPLHHSHQEGARTTGFEPAASRWTAGRSSPLSYVRVIARVGFEPTVSSS